MHRDHGIDTLLDLDGQVIDQGHGYWIKIEVWRIPPASEVPHGIRCSLTLHDPHGQRILGYDNAHAIKPPNKFKYAGRILPYDHKHRHRSDKGIAYEFQSAHQLLTDFFADVDRKLQETEGK